MKRSQLTAAAHALRFPLGCWYREGSGLWVSFDRRDRLERLEWRIDSRKVGMNLRLVAGQRVGCLEVPRGSGGTADTETYRRGRVTICDAWSDGSGPERMRWAHWSRQSVRRVLGLCGCVLCGSSLCRVPAVAHDKARRWSLCRECWARTSEEDPTPRLWPLGDRGCRICEQSFPDDALMYEGHRAKLCASCRASMHIAVDEVEVYGPPRHL